MKIKLVGNLVLILVLCISCSINQPEYTVKVFEVENGWGYSIFEQEKLIIRQQYIPSVKDQKHFKSKKDALTIGALVIEKLKHHKIPSITAQELKNNISL